jgi:hypothetical protein
VGRSLRIAVSALALTGLLVAPQTALAKKRKHRPPACSLSGSKTLLATRDARVFYKTSSKTGSTTEYACLFVRNKRFPLASGDSDPGGSGDTASLELLAGSYVAFVRGHYDDSTRYDPTFQGFPSTVVAINLSTGAELDFPAVAAKPAASSVSDLVLRRNGSFAWIGSGGGATEVHRLKVGDAADALLDSGANIEAGSLALGGGTLYWTKGGMPFSAPLG